jgi:hypothetical protein
MAKRDEHPVLLMENIDHIVCNVVFECLVLNVYGNSLISFTSPCKFVAFSYLHVDVIDTMGTTIITINIKI